MSASPGAPPGGRRKGWEDPVLPVTHVRHGERHRAAVRDAVAGVEPRGVAGAAEQGLSRSERRAGRRVEPGVRDVGVEICVAPGYRQRPDWSDAHPQLDAVRSGTADGVELGMRVAPVGPLTVAGSYTYLYTDVTNPGFDTSSGAALAPGQPLLRRPRHSARLDTGYRIPDRGTVSLAVTYVGDREDRIFPPFPAPAGRRAGARAHGASRESLRRSLSRGQELPRAAAYPIIRGAGQVRGLKSEEGRGKGEWALQRFSLVVVVALLAAGCSDALEQQTTAGQVLAVSDSGARTITVVSASGFRSRTVPLDTLADRPMGIGVQGNVLVVAMSTGGTVAVVHLSASADSVVKVIPLGGARLLWKVTVQNDSVACVTLVDSISLSGANPSFVTLGADSLIYVVNVGNPVLLKTGSVSVVDPMGRRELVLINGLGSGPGPAVYHPSGRLLVAAHDSGLVEVNTLDRSVTRAPGAGPLVGAFITGVAVDNEGRVYATGGGDCTAPGAVYVLSPPPDYNEIQTVTAGACPFAPAMATQP